MKCIHIHPMVNYKLLIDWQLKQDCPECGASECGSQLPIAFLCSSFRMRNFFSSLAFYVKTRHIKVVIFPFYPSKAPYLLKDVSLPHKKLRDEFFSYVNLLIRNTSGFPFSAFTIISNNLQAKTQRREKLYECLRLALNFA